MLFASFVVKNSSPRRVGDSLDFDNLSKRVIGLAIEVHRNLGPGLLESSYRECLAYELKENCKFNNSHIWSTNFNLYETL